MPKPPNLHKTLIKVAHSELKRWDEDSAYKSKCPVCEDGLLLIARDPKSFLLLRYDRCVSCGQMFMYTDETINGEGFAKIPMFELMGTPCEVPGCTGVLLNTISFKTQTCFKQCSICQTEFYKMPIKDMMSWAARTLESVFKGEKSN
jgi:hypothetical protein